MRTSHDYDRTGYCRQCGAYDKDMAPNCSEPTGEWVNGNFVVHTVTSAPDATISLAVGHADKVDMTNAVTGGVIDVTLTDPWAELRKEVKYAVRSVMLEEEVAKLKAEIAVLKAPRACTCHPDEAPVPCQGKYAFGECRAAASPIGNALTAMHRQFVAGDLAARFEPNDE